MNIIIKKKVNFNSAHRLHAPKLSDEENVRLYGKCNNFHGHGHDYQLIVALKGPLDPVTGMVFDFAELKNILTTHIIDIFDHKHLDLDTPYFKETPSTAENIAIVCWEILQKTGVADLLYFVELQETQDNIVMYYGENT
jgi:6-pyruvoyltetrahydropterin/6-carboxytetrahydropterin synthase